MGVRECSGIKRRVEYGALEKGRVKEREEEEKGA
jgi:hypothetical protein